MRYQNTITGIMIILVLAGGVFSFFYFSFDQIMKETVGEFFSDYFADFNRVEIDDVIEDIGEVWSPGPLVKEDDNHLSGVLTRAGIIGETNREREARNVAPLSENQKLNGIAKIKLNDMFENQYFAHISPLGVGVADIAKDTTYEYLLIGDNLAMGNYRDDSDIVNAWMMSPGHRRNILEERYGEIGVAAGKGNYEGREIWMAVQVFAMPSDACPEVDANLKREIERKKARAEELLSERDALQREIDAIRPRGGEEHIAKVSEYNKLVETYNNLIKSLDTLIEEYNQQIELRRRCVVGEGLTI